MRLRRQLDLLEDKEDDEAVAAEFEAVGQLDVENEFLSLPSDAPIDR
jgi:hypothetical protein